MPTFLFIDLDGTVCDYTSAVFQQVKERFDKNIDEKQFWEFVSEKQQPYKSWKDAIDRSDGFYLSLKPIPDAVETIKALAANENFEVFFLSSPDVNSDTCHSNKNQWIREHFGHDFCKKLILTSDKTIICGTPDSVSLLIDDLPQTGKNPKPIWTQVFKITPFNQDKKQKYHIENWERDYVMICLELIIREIKGDPVTVSFETRSGGYLDHDRIAAMVAEAAGLDVSVVSKSINYKNAYYRCDFCSAKFEFSKEAYDANLEIFECQGKCKTKLDRCKLCKDAQHILCVQCAK